MSASLWHYRDPISGLAVSINDRVRDIFARHRQRKFWHRERGGVLFAKSVGTNGHIEVCDATSPHELDRAGWSWLELDHQRCLEEIQDRFERGLHFVGYWHTHPEPHPIPSPRDVAALQRNLGGGGIPLQKLLAVIVGTSPLSRDLCVATIARNGNALSNFEHVVSP